MNAPRESSLHRLAMRVCPKLERPWLAALLAEASAIRSPVSRLGWQLGAVGLIARANVRRTLTGLGLHPLLAMVIALAGALLLASPSLLGFEVMNLEDDWFLAAGTLFGTLLLAAIAVGLLIQSHHLPANHARARRHPGILP